MWAHLECWYIPVVYFANYLALATQRQYQLVKVSAHRLFYKKSEFARLEN